MIFASFYFPSESFILTDLACNFFRYEWRQVFLVFRFGSTEFPSDEVDDIDTQNSGIKMSSL